MPSTTTSSIDHAQPPRASRSAAAPRRFVPQPAVAAPADLSTLLDRLADCESHRNPRAVSSNGLYFGAFQDTLKTWHNIGGTGNPTDHSYEEQKALNARIPVSFVARPVPHLQPADRRLMSAAAIATTAVRSALLELVDKSGLPLEVKQVLTERLEANEHAYYLDELVERDIALDDPKFSVTVWFGVCRRCGCTDEFGCAEGCSWVEDDLCSVCA